jgi:hypothetical protein
MRRVRVLVISAVVAASGVAAATGWLRATRQRVAPPPGDVREVIASHLADADAARDKYCDAPVIASGWSAGRRGQTR